MSNAKITADITQKRTITAEMVARGGGSTCDYTDLNNKPMINGITLTGDKTAEALNLADLEHTHTQSDITDFPTLATVATTNNYQDLDGKLQAGAGILIEDNVISATGGGGTTSDIAWLPNVSTDGDLSWQRSEIVTPPETVNIKGADGRDGAKGDKGEQGEKGDSGIDGVSPIATVSKVDTTATITITDINGTTTATVQDGLKGDKGDKGIDGLKGDTGDKGDKGENGIDGLTVSVNGIEQVDGDITLTASEIPVENENFVATDIDGALDELFTSVSNGKTLIASAITDKGVTTLATDTFAVMADKIGQIEGGGGGGEQLGIYPVGDDGRPTGDVVVPSGVTSLYRYLFDGNQNVTNVQLPAGMTTIGTYSFNNCANLADISIPSTVVEIGSNAFAGCTKLVSIHIPNSVTDLGVSAFAYCYGLVTITLSSSITRIRTQVFQNCTSLITIILPSSVTQIDTQAFGGCANLTTITLPSSIAVVDNQAFGGCSKLASVDCKAAVCIFAANVFNACSALTNFITYPNFNPTNIGFATNINLSVASMVNMSNNLVDLTGQTAKTITLGATNLAKLTTEQKQVFIDKNWALA